MWFLFKMMMSFLLSLCIWLCERGWFCLFVPSSTVYIVWSTILVVLIGGIARGVAVPLEASKKIVKKKRGDVWLR